MKWQTEQWGAVRQRSLGKKYLWQTESTGGREYKFISVIKWKEYFQKLFDKDKATFKVQILKQQNQSGCNIRDIGAVMVEEKETVLRGMKNKKASVPGGIKEVLAAHFTEPSV